jgi:SAM-dependent MidA family methyltransferase
MNTPAATPSLQEILRARIASGGPLAFPDFMAAALYHPEHGYYAGGTRQVGRAGDFFTSVSVGPVFGKLLARRFLAFWRDEGMPPRWRIIECGAHDGSLAADVLDELRDLEAAAFDTLEYTIAEPLVAMRECQVEKLRDFAGKCLILPDLAPLADDPLPGIAIGNELLDALPCHLLVRRGGQWLERAVGWGKAGFEWHETEIADPDLTAAVAALGHDFPDGYCTEIRTDYRDFLTPLSNALCDGLMLWIDYGFDRADYYHPSRVEGTLRTFSRHRADDDPLDDPGGRDITAHVDFTAVAEAARVLGWQARPLRSQGAWLTEIAREWLLAMEGRPQPALLRQFQALTHPAQLGARFQMLELLRQSP